MAAAQDEQTGSFSDAGVKEALAASLIEEGVAPLTRLGNNGLGWDEERIQRVLEDAMSDLLIPDQMRGIFQVGTSLVA